MSETTARATAFGNGYQAALKDVAKAFHDGDLPGLASWITQNLSVDSLHELGEEVLRSLMASDVWAADNADPTPWPQGSADPAARDAAQRDAEERQIRHDDALIATFGAREAGRLIELEALREAERDS